jgi:hypothetical protein
MVAASGWDSGCVAARLAFSTSSNAALGRLAAANGGGGGKTASRIMLPHADAGAFGGRMVRQEHERPFEETI